MQPIASESLTDTPEYQNFSRYIRLRQERRELDFRLDQIKSDMKALEAILLGYLATLTEPLFAVEGFLVSPVREPWVYPLAGIERDQVCQALKAADLAHFVKETYSTRTLTAYVRDLEKRHQLVTGVDPEALKELLPEELTQVLEVRPAFRLQVTDKRKHPKSQHTAPEGEYLDDQDTE